MPYIPIQCQGQGHARPDERTDGQTSCRIAIGELVLAYKRCRLKRQNGYKTFITSIQKRWLKTCCICMHTRGHFYKKAVLSQRWPRDARYISRSWSVANIWPFKIIQDGGRRHLEFVQIENSAIRSAVPENPVLEQNMKWIGRPVAEISPLEIFPTWRWPPSWICSNRK